MAGHETKSGAGKGSSAGDKAAVVLELYPRYAAGSTPPTSRSDVGGGKNKSRPKQSTRADGLKQAGKPKEAMSCRRCEKLVPSLVEASSRHEESSARLARENSLLVSELERESMHAREARARAWHWQRAAEDAVRERDTAVASGERAKAVREWGIVALFALFCTLFLWQGGHLGGFVEYVRGESGARVTGESQTDRVTVTTNPVASNPNRRSAADARRVAPGRGGRRTRNR